MAFSQKRIVFIVQQLSQPRCVKRIQGFRDAGYNCIVYGFNNGLYEGNLVDIGFDIQEEWIVDKNDGKVRKICLYIDKIKHVIDSINRDDVIYAFGFEIGTIVSFFWRYKYIYEEADVSASRIKNFLFRNFLIKLDQRVIRRSILTIFTSEGFQDYLFGSNVPYSNKIIFIHNKLHESFIESIRPSKKSFDIENLKFGFVGLIRYPNTILRFAEVIGRHFPNHEFHFYGDVEGNCLEQVNWSNYQNIIFHGKFKNPDDLSHIYSQIDINVVCYDPSSGNVRIAEPNKLYESIFFNKPIVVSQNTFLQRRVEDLNVGFAINALSDSSIIEFVNSIEENDLNAIHDVCLKIDKGSLINDSNNDLGKIKKYLNLI